MTITADFLKPGEEMLSAVTMFIGIIFAAVNIPALVIPDKTASIWNAFPRSVWPGRLLATISLVWAGFWLNAMAIGFLTPIKEWLVLLVPAAVVVVSYGIPELLACRALGGIMVLLPCPMLSAAQWHPSNWRYFILVFAYIIASFGMISIALPYQMRDIISGMTKSKQQLRFFAALGTVLALFLIVISLTVFRISPDEEAEPPVYEESSLQIEHGV